MKLLAKFLVAALFIGAVVWGAVAMAAEVECESVREGVELVERKARWRCLIQGVSDTAENRMDRIWDETTNRENGEG